ncbi:MAG: hypothetical protein GXY74_10585 [Phycisphaerae bacterium]|nr:hypothetical protein [Phycisphaerae bacterium]
MSATCKPMSQWRMMLIGRSSVVMKRIFVVALALVSLGVWGITILGMGVLRSDPAPQTVTAVQGQPVLAAASLPQGQAAVVTAAANVEQKSVAVQAVWAAGKDEASPVRNPFLPDEESFPTNRPAASDVAAGAVSPEQQQEEAKAARGPSEEELRQADESARTMVLIGTTVGENGPQAVIDGVRCRVGDTVGVMTVSEIGRGTATVEFAGRRYELRVPLLEGTLMGGRSPMAMIDGRGYGVGQCLVTMGSDGSGGKTPVTTSVRIKEIKAQSVVLAVGDADFELGMVEDKSVLRDQQRR